MTILLFFKKMPKDPDEATKISTCLAVVGILALVGTMFLVPRTSSGWWLGMLALWLFMDSATYMGWSKGYLALQIQLISEMTKEEKERLTEALDQE